MSKPVTGKTHVGQRRERCPNGDIYLYERVTGYNERTRKTYTVSQKLKGKIKSGTQEIILTRPKKSKREGGVVGALRRHSGLTDILEWVGKASGIDDDVHSSFSEGDAAKILSIARYWIGSGGNTLPRLEGWLVMHSLPYSAAITEDVYSDLLGPGEDMNRIRIPENITAGLSPSVAAKLNELTKGGTCRKCASENCLSASHGPIINGQLVLSVSG